MPYTAEISRTNPGCFLFLIDQSGSMAEPFGAGDTAQSKAQGVSEAINRLLQTLCIRCAKEEGVRDYFHIGVISYGAGFGPALGEPLAGRELVPVSEVAENPVRIEERTQKITNEDGEVEEHTFKFPVWFEPVAKGNTPMCGALNYAGVIVEKWLAGHPDCFSPIVINITDGEATDGNPYKAAEKLKDLACGQGNILLFNLHLSSHKGPALMFPGSDQGLPDQFARLLFSISSRLTPVMREMALELYRLKVSENSRGFAFNASMIEVVSFLDIGTRAGNLRRGM